MLIRCLSFTLLFTPGLLAAQVVNGYARVTSVSGASLTLGASSEAGAAFTVGKSVIIMQMQDDVIGANTADNVNFGNLGAIQQAGRFEVRVITAVARDIFGAPTGITLNAAPGLTYNTGTNSSVQVITYELLGGGGNFTTTANIAALAWNGSIGGVVAIRVTGTLTLAHRITADGAGFRGGARDPLNFSLPCNGATFRSSSIAGTTDQFATKGESIYRLTNTDWADARGKILNGGGGANMVNAGGGGGGNYTTGGAAVLGWSCGTIEAGGLGGINLSGQVSASRVFLGGGGGGGEGNDNLSTDGGNGGGIILIDAVQIRTVGTCAGIRISADGITAANSGNDGGGGGGAGGSIVLQCPLYAFAATCPMVIRSNGGGGGTVNSTTHGGGGGGGQGVIIFSSPAPVVNVTTSVLNGTGGCNETPCITRANNGGGTNNSGILIGMIGVLPVELISFQAIPVGTRVDITWVTASERDNDYFTVERSVDGERWGTISTVAGAGNSQERLTYTSIDPAPRPGVSYYRVGQTDLDGTTTYSEMVAVSFEGLGAGLVVYPNPAQHGVTVLHDEALGQGTVSVLDQLGRSVELQQRSMPGRTELDATDLPTGVYTVVFQSGDQLLQQRLLVDH